MNQAEYDKEEEEVIESFLQIGKMQITGNQVVFIGIGILIAKLLLWMVRILWCIKERQAIDAERVDDGVNCLVRIEHAIYEWRQNR
jgi:hypothetical protein